MPTKCEDCGSPATAGQVPTKPGHHYCVDCASLETLELQGTNEKLDAPPPAITGGPAWPITAGLASGPALWQHQAMALKQLDQGLNTVVATPTASGKSLIFHLHTLTKLINDPGATTMVFYPTKALAHDQARRWQESCRTLELPDHTLGHIDGDVPMNRRDAIIRNARVLILTPDVCHAWLLRRANTPDVSTFLVNLQTIIIDEAHTYESVFGSNAAYLFRRLTSAAAAAGNPNPPQFIAATATILVPDRHLNQLTGRPFEVIKHSETGAPRFPRKVHHLMTAPGPTREIQLAQLITTIIDADPNAQVIAFHDSRQGVERVVQAINRPHSVMPYRAGYLATDRREIENKLRDNTIRAVIATNALELGIDMPDLNYGINLGVPPSRKQFHQRLGRIGRTQPGTFIILDTADAFSRHGDTLEHYYLNSVEHSHLYLNNEYVTFQQAQCLKAELEDLGRDTRTPPRECRWPTLFDQALKNAHGRPPPHLSEIDARTMSSAPQLAHNLRSSGEETLRITSASQGPDEARRFQKNIGSINFTKAITEAYPGAIYHHRGNSYRVEKWARKQQDNSGFIEVTKVPTGISRTRPITREMAVLVPTPELIISNRPMERGQVTHMLGTVVKSVEGYHESTIRDTVHYHKARETDPRLTRKEHQMPTTMVHVRIYEDWFTGVSAEPWQARSQLAEALKSHLAYQNSVIPADLGIQVDNIIIQTPLGFYASENSLIIYDNIYGGMGLVADIYQNLDRYAGIFSVDPNRDGNGQLYAAYAQQFREWLNVPLEGRPTPTPEPGRRNWWRVIRPGSGVTLFSRKKDRTVEGTVTGYLWDEGIRYTVDAQEEQLTTTDRQVTLSGPNHDWQLWKPSTNTAAQLPAG